VFCGVTLCRFIDALKHVTRTYLQNYTVSYDQPRGLLVRVSDY
jgi:hypothetical protein